MIPLRKMWRLEECYKSSSKSFPNKRIILSDLIQAVLYNHLLSQILFFLSGLYLMD